MAKLINKTQGYTIVGQNISMDGRLGMKERGLLLTLLSLPDNWEFSVIGLSKILPDGKAAIQSTVQKLEKLGYLKRVQTKGEKGKFAGYDWEIISLPEVVEAPLTENRSTAKKSRKSPLTENRSTENPSTEKPSTENQSQLNTKELNTKKSNNNQSINHNEEPEQPTKKSDRLIDRKVSKKVIDKYLIEDVRDQIEYDTLKEKFDAEMLDTVVSCIANLYTVSEPQDFSGSTYAPEFVHRRSLEINASHIEYVFECFEQQRDKVFNIPKYLRAAIFNAPDTISAYYTNAVRAEGLIS